MNVLIAACVYHTKENNRLPIIKQWFRRLCSQTIFQDNVRIIIYDNSPISIKENLIEGLVLNSDVTFLGGDGVNLGTAEGINQCWKLRKDGEYLVKIDDDVIIYNECWFEEMSEAIERMPELGLLALKRKDLTENPSHPNPDGRTELLMVPQQKGERWIVVEKVKNVFGTVQMFSPALFEKIGYMEQIGKYGFDDYLMSVKCYAAGFIGAFLPHIEIEHIDKGGGEYTDWKVKVSGEVITEVMDLAKKYKSGIKPLYYEGRFNK